MKDWRVRKGGGLSWIEVCGGVHVFLAGDRRHRGQRKFLVSRVNGGDFEIKVCAYLGRGVAWSRKS